MVALLSIHINIKTRKMSTSAKRHDAEKCMNKNPVLQKKEKRKKSTANYISPVSVRPCLISGMLKRNPKGPPKGSKYQQVSPKTVQQQSPMARQAVRERGRCWGGERWWWLCCGLPPNSRDCVIMQARAIFSQTDTEFSKTNPR